ncbi:hypothetical protein L596_005339 [Steinernema carpocapsae]|uniref:Uncharacterized protein n=1 Tax=Steinernema carpocapsae TaxID=34508 RepID=A0A4U8V057_STECR|nr:hypothetical protein L596_005339 [Steinernema carpocapsae]
MGKLRPSPQLGNNVPLIRDHKIEFKKSKMGGAANKPTTEEEKRQRLKDARAHYSAVSRQARSDAPLRGSIERSASKPLMMRVSKKTPNEQFMQADIAFEKSKLFTPHTPISNRHNSILPKELAHLKLNGDYKTMLKDINSARKKAAETRAREAEECRKAEEAKRSELQNGPKWEVLFPTPVHSAARKHVHFADDAREVSAPRTQGLPKSPSSMEADELIMQFVSYTRVLRETNALTDAVQALDRSTLIVLKDAINRCVSEERSSQHLAKPGEKENAAVSYLSPVLEQTTADDLDRRVFCHMNKND